MKVVNNKNFYAKINDRPNNKIFLFCFLMVAKIKRLRELSHIDEERAICALSQFNWNIEQALQNL